MCGLVFVMNLSRVVFAPLIEPFIRTFGISAGEAGLVATLAWLGSAAPRLPTGYLLTRVARHRVVLAAGGVLTAAALFTSTVESPLGLYAGALAMGLATGVYFIAANPLVSELFPGQVGRAIGIHGTANQVAAVGAPVLAGAVLAAGTWRDVFVIVAVVAGLATVALAAFARRADLPRAGADDRDFLGAIRSQWPLIVSGVAIIGITGLVWNGVFNFYVSYLVDAKPVTEPTARNLLTLAFAAGVPAFWFGGRLADRLPYVPLLLSLIGAFVACVLALTAAQGLAALVAVSVLVGLVIHSLFPAIDTFLLDSLPDHHRGSAYAAYSATMMLVSATGSVIVGSLRDLGVGFDAVFQGFAVGLFALLVVLLALYRAGRIPSGASPA
ncbi:MFS transporter [Halobacteriales archaeon QS_8_69_26]|nr:MAG: MFS transporter [Halobacteriales archaeon QS_8_69_26]